MVKNFLLFIFVSFLFLSCNTYFSKKRSFIFDEVAFSNAKQKWQETKIATYSYKYTFYGDAGLPELAIGEVIVSDNIGTINKLELHIMHKDGEDFYYVVSNPKNALDREKGDDGGKLFYEEVQKIEDRKGYTIQVKTIDEVFDLIEQRLSKLQNKFDTDPTVTKCELLVKYNAQTGIPERISEYTYRTTDPKPGLKLEGWTNCSLRLTLSNFNSN